jgi:hypothetical protein
MIGKRLEASFVASRVMYLSTLEERYDWKKVRGFICRQPRPHPVPLRASSPRARAPSSPHSATRLPFPQPKP